MNGTWHLVVSDAFGLSRYGLLEDWSITFAADNELTYSWIPSVDLSCTDCPNPTATPDTTTTYQCAIQDAYGCADILSTTLTVNPVFPAPEAICGSMENNILTVHWNAIPGAGSYEVNVNQSGWMSANGSLSHLINGLSNGDSITLEIRVPDSDPDCPSAITTLGCRYLNCQMYAVIEDLSPPSCHNGNDGEVFISAYDGTAPFTYELDGQLVQVFGYFNTVSAGPHEVIVTDAMGCMDTVSFVMSEPDPIEVNVALDSVSCTGGNDGGAIAAASGGVGPYQYIWFTIPALFDSTLQNVPAGSYSLRVTDDNACLLDTLITIPEPEPLDLTVAIDSVTCAGGSDGSATVNVTGGSGPYTFLWSDGQFLATATALSVGTYTVTVTDQNGCSASTMASIPTGPANEYQIQSVPPRCSDSADGIAWVEVISAPQPISVFWAAPIGSSADTAIGLAPGSYSAMITDAVGCMDTILFAISSTPEIQTSTSSTPTSCWNSADGTAEVMITSGGTPPFAYQWSDPLNQSNAQATQLLAGIYTVTITDSVGCTLEAVATIAAPDSLELSTQITNATCTTSGDGQGTVTVLQGGTAPYTYLWNDPASTSGSVLNGVNPGQYEVVVTDANGCTASTVLEIGEDAPLMIDTILVDPVLCSGDANGSLTVVLLSPVPPASFQWSDSNSQSNNPATGLPAGTYTVTVTDGLGCTATASANLTDPPVLTVTSMAVPVDCPGLANGRVQAIGTGGTPPYLYVWDDPLGQTDSIALGLAAGPYTVTITDANGCTAMDSDLVLEPPALTLALEAISPGCAQTASGLLEGNASGGTPPYLFQLNNGPLVNSGVFTPLASGAYTLIVTDSNGCSQSADTTLVDPSAFTVDAGPDITIELGETAPLLATASGATAPFYFWQAPYDGTLSCQACPDPIASPKFTITYEVVVEDENGCEARDVVTVVVEQDRTILVPTAFSPNGDGQNDRLLVHGDKNARIIVFRVFDRWGELLYMQEDFPVNAPSIGWDGRHKGEQMNSGVYIWTLEVEFLDGYRKLYSGQTTLLR